MRRHVLHIAIVTTLFTLALAGCTNGPATGTAAPAFSAADQDGESVSLAALDGSVVVLDFWATWCPPCVAASRSIQTLHEQFAGDDVVVLGVHFDDKGDPAAYLADHGYTFANIPDGRDVVRSFGISQIPTIVVLDRSGTVVFSQTGFAPGDEETVAEVVRAHL